MLQPNKSKLSLKDKVKVAKSLIKQGLTPKSKKEKLESKKSKQGFEDYKTSISNEFKKGGNTKNNIMAKTLTKKQKGGSTNIGGPSGFNSPGAVAMRADNDARKKYYTPDNIRKEGIKLSDKQIEKNVKADKNKLYDKYMKESNLAPAKKSTAKKMAKGGSTDKNWIQKATASIKRRGTEGKCTPITKPGCTGKAKALAKTFKKIAKNR